MPLFQYPKNESCTAILDLDTLKWSKLGQKGPLNIDEMSFFFLISDEKKEHIFLLGGGQSDISFAGKQLLYHKIMKFEPNYRVQLLDGHEWKFLAGPNISQRIFNPITTVPLDFYHNNNFPQVDAKNLRANRKLTNKHRGVWWVYVPT